MTETRFPYWYKKQLCDKILKLPEQETELIINAQKTDKLFWFLEMIIRLKKLNPINKKHKPVKTGMKITFY